MFYHKTAFSTGKKSLSVGDGFTLIELLVVIAIIGVLASIILVSLNDARTKARDAKRIQDLNSIITAMEIYFLDNPDYAGEGDNGGVHISPKCSSDIRNDLIAAGLFADVPADPRDASTACTDHQDDSFFYGWDSTHCCEGEFIVSINRLESQWAVDQLLEKFGSMHCVTGGGHANIGTGDDFNYCFKPR